MGTPCERKSVIRNFRRWRSRNAMIFVIGDQVIQRESIMGRDKIDAGVGTPPIVLIKIGTACEPVSHLANAALVAFPKTPHRIAIFAVPFRPKDGKISNLIAAFAYVPRLRD